MIEAILALEWLNGILVPDTELADPDTGVLGGWHNIAPAKMKSPYGIVRQLTGSEDLMALDDGAPTGETIWVPVIMQVILYDRTQSNFLRIAPLAQRAYDLLQRQLGDIEGGSIFGCYRSLAPIAKTDTVGDSVERSIEQQFTIQLRAG